MDREYGARDALAFVRRSDFPPSKVAFRRRDAARMSETGFLTMGQARRGAIPAIGVGMLAYAFMGKAHAQRLTGRSDNGVAAPGSPELVSFDRTRRPCGEPGGTSVRLRRSTTRWDEVVNDEEVGALRQQRSQQPAR